MKFLTARSFLRNFRIKQFFETCSFVQSVTDLLQTFKVPWKGFKHIQYTVGSVINNADEVFKSTDEVFCNYVPVVVQNLSNPSFWLVSIKIRLSDWSAVVLNISYPLFWLVLRINPAVWWSKIKNLSYPLFWLVRSINPAVWLVCRSPKYILSFILLGPQE